jgi:hypothetical protein
MKHPPFNQITATTFIDQAGASTPLILGLDAWGGVWQKPGHLPWAKVSDEAVEGEVKTPGQIVAELKQEEKSHE